MGNRPQRRKERVYEQDRRESPSKRGYGRRWQKLRKVHIENNPLCVECLRMGKATPGVDVDHIEPHRGDAELLHDAANLQTLCKRCHALKTARGL